MPAKAGLLRIAPFHISTSEAMDDCLEFECDPEMVAAARQFVRDRLTSWEVAESEIDAAILVTSELVTNAILHARTAINLGVQVNGPSVRIEVSDDNPRLPALGPCPPDATSGRGLALVSAIGTAWGMENRGEGKVVWAEVGPPDDDGSSEADDCVDLSGVNTVDEAIDRIHNSGSDTDTASA